MIKRSIIKKQMAKRISAAVLAATLCVSACPNSVVGQEVTEIETVETTETSEEVVETTEAESVVEESQAETTEDAVMEETQTEATEEAVAEEPQAETTEEAVAEEPQAEITEDGQEFNFKVTDIEFLNADGTALTDNTLVVDDDDFVSKEETHWEWDVYRAEMKVKITLDKEWTNTEDLNLGLRMHGSADSNKRTMDVESYEINGKNMELNLYSFLNPLEEGTYTLTDLYYSEYQDNEWKEYSIDVSAVADKSFNFKYGFSDVTAPEVESVSFKGVEEVNGKNVLTDVSAFEVEIVVKDEHDLWGPGISLRTDAHSIGSKYISLDYKETNADGNRVYVGTLSEDTVLENTEWYIKGFYSKDICQNNADIDFEEAVYFCVNPDSEDYIVPTYEYKMWINNIEGITNPTTVIVESGTTITLAELIAKCELPELENLIGWNYYGKEISIEETNSITFTPERGHDYVYVDLSAIYEKPDTGDDGNQGSGDTENKEDLDIKITNIQISNKDVVLTDDNRYENITITIPLEGKDVASIQEEGRFYVYIQRKDAKEYESVYSLNTTYNAQKKQLEATIRVSGNMQATDYIVETVYISVEYGLRNIINTYTGDKTAFSVTKKTTDQEAPVVNAVQIYVNNTLQTTGAVTLKKGDVITVRADVDDKNRVSGIFYFMNDNTSFYGEINPSAYDLEGQAICNGTTIPEGTFHIYYLGVSDWYGNQIYYYEEDVVALYKEVKPNPQNATLIGNKTTSEKLEAIGKNIKEAMNVKGAVSEQTKANVENALKNGYTITPEISVSSVPANSVESNVKAEIQEQADAVFGENTKVAYLDISLNLLANGTTLGTLNKLAEPISITVKLPEALNGNYNYKVIRYHENADGTAETEILDATKNADGTITFKTDRFSTYAIAYSTNTAKSPITGQTGMTVIYLAFAVSAIVAVVYSKKRVY